MIYMGSKARFAKEILQIILKDRKPDQIYIEPFAGGMNTICEVDGIRIANDLNHYLIQMWCELMNGWKPNKITIEEYNKIKNNKDHYPPHIVGWAGFVCSFRGKWFGSFAKEVTNRVGINRDYQSEAIRNIYKQVNKMKGVIFQNLSFTELEIPPNSIVYCDPPYYNTTEYCNTINHTIFFNWVRNIVNQGNTVYVSEYSAPDDFECVWEKQTISSLSANGKKGGSKSSVEKLFMLRKE